MIRLLVALIVLSLVFIANRTPFDPSQPTSAPPPVWTPITVDHLSHGRFEDLTIYSPHGTPRGFILLVSGGGGWTPLLNSLAMQLAGDGALVTGIDGAQLEGNLTADPAGCVFPDGDLENVSHFVQAYYHLPTYLPPILGGDAEGAALVYAVLAQAPPHTFGGAVSMRFCPLLQLRKPLCKSGTLDDDVASAGFALKPAAALTAPWRVLRWTTDDADGAVPSGAAAPAAPPTASACAPEAVQDFVTMVPGATLVSAPAPTTAASWPAPYIDAFEELIRANAPSPQSLAPPVLADLPLIVLAGNPGAPAGDTFAVMLSGDGGWAGLDQDVAAALTDNGIPVIGLDSLRYFWSARTPSGIAADLDRIIGYYSTALRKPHVVLIGYSQGADVLPFAVNRLSAAARSRVTLAAIMGMSEHALFEFHVSSWLADDQSGPATLPEVNQIHGIPVLCIYGSGETDTLCPKLDPNRAIIVKLQGGHHFDGNYAGLARRILDAARR